MAQLQQLAPKSKRPQFYYVEMSNPNYSIDEQKIIVYSKKELKQYVNIMMEGLIYDCPELKNQVYKRPHISSLSDLTGNKSGLAIEYAIKNPTDEQIENYEDVFLFYCSRINKKELGIFAEFREVEI